MDQLDVGKVLRWMLVLLFVYSSNAQAGDWPQWRGPFLNGSTDEKSLPDVCSVTSNLKWSTPMPGEAGSTPIVSGDRIFLTSTDKDKNETYAMGLDSRTGRILWRKTVNTEHRSAPHSTNASPSPVTDGKRVFFMFGSGEFLATDFNGEALWQRNLEADFGPMTQLFFYGATPLLYREKLYLSMLRDNPSKEMHATPRSFDPVDSFVLCVDPASGKDIWKCPRPVTTSGPECRDSYATPMAWEFDGKAEILIIGASLLTGHDWATGQETWRMRYAPDGGYRQRVVPSPVVYEDLAIFSQPRAGPLFAVKQGMKGDTPYENCAWTYKGGTPDAPSVLAYENRLFCLQDSKKTMTCLDPKTGRKIWESPIGGEGIYHSSPTGADGKIYCLSLEGDLSVLRAGDKFELISRSRLGGNPCRSTIVAAQGCIFVRTTERLYCFKK